MRILLNILKKDLLLILRDRVGLALLFIMPISLVVIMTLLQDSTFKALEDENIKLIIIDNDRNIVGSSIIAGLDSAKVFDITQTNSNGDTITVDEALGLVSVGEYKMVLVIPPKTTRTIKRAISKEIKIQMPSLGAKPSKLKKKYNSDIEIFFDPVIKASFKKAILGSVREIIANVQTQLVFKSYTSTIKKITGRKNDNFFPINIVCVTEKPTGKFAQAKLPTSTQHNVPAWTIFAIFFIVIPLSGQIIFEKTEGTLFRLKTTPVSYYQLMLSKILIFTKIAILQALLLVLIGMYILPLMGMPQLIIKDIYQIFDIVVFTFFIGLAATGYSVFIGTVAKNQHQASIFGSISVVILAAIGGIWVPIYIMNDFMLSLSSFSPLNWAITGFYNIFLRNESVFSLYAEIIKLTAFFVVTLSISAIYEKRKIV